MSDPSRQWLVFGTAWIQLTLRKWLLPGLMIGAVAEQTLTNALSAEQMLLNGIAICFIMVRSEYVVYIYIYIYIYTF